VGLLKKKMKKIYIFDFDGTLVDSMPFWAEKMLNILKSANVSYPDDIITTIATMGDAGSAKYFREVLGVKYTEKEMFDMMDKYGIPKYRDEIMLKDGVKEALLALKADGNSLNVLTASPHKMLDPCLKRNGIYELFDNVWSTDDFGLAKTNVEIYRLAVSKTGGKVSDALFFDDNLGALKTAKKAGLYTVGVFDETGKPFMEDIIKTADKFIYSFNDI